MAGIQSTDVVFDDAQAFLRSAVLAGSVRMGVFNFLEAGDRTFDQLARMTKVGRSTLRALVDALVLMGYVVRRGRRYGLSLVSKECLVRGGREYMGDAVGLVAHPTIWSAMGRFADGGRSAEAAIDAGKAPSIVDATGYWVDFAEQSEWLAKPVAEVMVATLGVKNLTEETWVLDVGCGNGLCALALAEANPLVNAILVDRGEVLMVSGEYAERLGVTDRVTMLPGDVFEVLPSRQVDVIIVSLVLHHYDLDTCSRLLRRLGGCLKRGGCIVIHDYLRGETSLEETSIALLAVVMAVCTGGDIYTLGDYRRILRQSGFRGCRSVEASPNGESWLIVATKS